MCVRARARALDAAVNVYMFSVWANDVYGRRRSRAWIAIRATGAALSSVCYPNEHLLLERREHRRER